MTQEDAIERYAIPISGVVIEEQQGEPDEGDGRS